MFKSKLVTKKALNPAKIVSAVQRATREELLQTAERVYGISQVLVPVDKGDLQESGEIIVSRDGDQVDVVYGTNHAIAQEYGTNNQSGTPFLRPAAEQISEESGRYLGRIKRRVEQELK